MKTLYLDIFSGISGDMFIGALIDLGVDAHALDHELEKLGVGGYHLHVSRQARGAIAGTKFDVHTEHDHSHEHGHEHHAHGDHDDHHEHGHEHHHDEHSHGHHERGEQEQEREQEHEHEHKEGRDHHGRTFGDIRGMIGASGLSEWVKQKAIAVFARVAEAEGKIHGQPADQVHFHEVGAIDSIVDIVGACIALDMLGRPRVLAGGVIEGTGTIRCAHGRFPLPAPATLEILRARGVAIQQCEEPGELVTPTGAALLSEFAESFGPMPPLIPTKIGYGLGTRENKTRPNVLRAILAETAGPAVAPARDWETDSIAVLETNLDDINAELLGHFVEKAFAAGALDVFHTPIQMKKNRPGVLLTVLCAGADADRFCEMMLKETSAFGVRRTSAERRKLRRELATVTTAYGEVTVKIGKLDGRIAQISPEFESCKRLATERGVPLKDVYDAALRAFSSGEAKKT